MQDKVSFQADHVQTEDAYTQEMKIYIRDMNDRMT